MITCEYIRHSDLSYTITGTKVEKTGEVHLKYQFGYNGAMLTANEQVMTKDELKKLIDGLVQIHENL